ncbi:MAG: ATP-binding protein [Cyanobacteria bacterium P01_D01_bin.73]
MVGWPSGWLRRQKITSKIALGYGISLSIALLGSSAGLIVGSWYESQASRDRDAATTRAELVARLENDALTLALHPQHLLTAMDEPLWLRYETSQFKSDISVLRSSITRFDALVLSQNFEQGEIDKAAVVSTLRSFLDDYEVWVQSLWSALASTGTNAVAGQTPYQQKQRMMTVLAAELSQPRAKELQIKLERLSEQLALMVVSSNQLKRQAFVQFQWARSLRIWIVVASFVLSSALAIACALYISRAIARPIHQVTDQTHRITRERDFDLRVSVDTEDETARLAASIDQLVRWAGEYTHELELAQTTLEQRVDERTQELRIAQAQMVQSEKMSSLGQMVAGVAHEINNPVGFIYSNIDYATEYVKDLLALVNAYRSACPEQWRTEAIAQQEEEIDLEFLEKDVMKVLNSMQVGADRIKDIVLSLRTFSRVDESDLKSANLHDSLDSTLTILGHRLKANSERDAIDIVRNYGDLPLVNCYVGQLNQVFMNLLANAIDALEEGMKGGANLQAKESKISGSSPLLQIVISTRLDGDRCLINIRDNGSGIEPDVCNRIFDPFFTTKPTGKGTGMGLAISHQIVTEKHGGRLSCASAPGEGTTFTIEIPTEIFVADPISTTEAITTNGAAASEKLSSIQT